MYNHSTFVLGYLLLMGYDVTGKAYLLRVEGLLAGMVLCMVVFIRIRKTARIAGRFWTCSENLTCILQEAGGI